MSRFAKLLVQKKDDLYGCKPVTVAFLGDSVTQGCFEVYPVGETALETIYDVQSAYSTKFRQLLATVCPKAPVNIVNAGISGGGAPNGLERLERDVLAYHPDLAVVCFGLNDCTRGMEHIGEYTDALTGIFVRLREEGIETVFMTPNMVSDSVSWHIQEPRFKELAAMLAGIQKGGTLDSYMDAAREAAAKCGVRVCDCYSRWRKLNRLGIDTTDLLSNYLNHPTRDMHWLFANALFETLFYDEETI